MIRSMECILIYFNRCMLFKEENCGLLLIDIKSIMLDFEQSNQLKQVRNVVYVFINSQVICKTK